jgi:hypothetical protein
MALAQHVDAAIRAQQAEIARIRETTRTELEKAQARLEALQAARAMLTPEIEAILMQLAGVGIHVRGVTA